MVTIRDLARLAGVSPMTVSRALRDQPCISVTRRAEIQNLATIYGYHAPYKALAGVEPTSVRIGCIFPDISQPYASRVLKGIMERSCVNSVQVLLMKHPDYDDHPDTPKMLEKMFIELLNQQVRGFIFYQGCYNDIPSVIRLRLQSRNIPMVILDAGHNPPFPIDTISSDESQIGKLVVDYLFKLGHQNIAMFGNGPNLTRRWDGLMSALCLRGLSTRHCYHTMDNFTTLRKLMALPHRPSAIIAFADNEAAQYLNELHMLGIRVPQDVSVTGCANMMFSELIRPHLTSIEQHPEEIGHRAIDLLLRRLLEDPAARPPVEMIYQQSTLVIRDSCARPPKQ
jgi:DNA-binding LacI/PurR family transcriptional regulator